MGSAGARGLEGIAEREKKVREHKCRVQVANYGFQLIVAMIERCVILQCIIIAIRTCICHLLRLKTDDVVNSSKIRSVSRNS